MWVQGHQWRGIGVGGVIRGITVHALLVPTGIIVVSATTIVGLGRGGLVSIGILTPIALPLASGGAIRGIVAHLMTGITLHPCFINFGLQVHLFQPPPYAI
jgi:hypothetical protein